MVLATLLGGFIVILVGVNLMPTISQSVTNLTDQSGNGTIANMSNAPVAIMNLVVLFFALGIMTAGVALAMNALKEAGVV